MPCVSEVYGYVERPNHLSYELKGAVMSRIHKVSIVLALAVLTALGVSLIRGWPPLAIAAGRTQVPENDTLFFVSGLQPQPRIQRMAASEPRQLAEQTATAATESILLNTGVCEIAGLYASPNGRWVAVEVGCEASVHTLVMAATGEIRPIWPEPWESSFFLNWAPDGDALLVRVGHLGESMVFLVNARNGRVERMDTPLFTTMRLSRRMASGCYMPQRRDWALAARSG